MSSPTDNVVHVTVLICRSAILMPPGENSVE
jgi:hypothetical protein